MSGKPSEKRGDFLFFGVYLYYELKKRVVVGWWWFFLYKEYVFPIVFVRLFDMCNGGCICLVMKPAPLHLQALGAKHPEPQKKQSQIKST